MMRKYLVQYRNQTDLAHVPHRKIIFAESMEHLLKQLEEIQDFVDILLQE